MKIVINVVLAQCILCYFGYFSQLIIIDLKHFDARLLKIDKSYKNTGIYYIGYITIKKTDDSESIHSANPLYLHINHASGYIEKKMGINI